MICTLKENQVLDSDFEILDVRELSELNAIGVWAKHTKCGAEVYHVYNDDKENLFTFAFATPPLDSTGAAHILEHAVLCGSESFPLKDAFLVLAQGSLQTYLNAWTTPDKTLFPASSVNEQDYFNLMAVYGDAVFRPLLSEWTFMQEGQRLTFNPDKKPALEYSGVVYNEMKGAFSSLETYAGHWSIKSVMPDTPYAFESGGDPSFIPDLSWEKLKDFHSLYYTPSNCRIFLAGNIPTEKQLAFLDKYFFSKLPAGNKAALVKRAEAWDKERSIKINCPAGSESKATVLLSWLCNDVLDINESMGLFALTEILLGHDGSPLTRALINSSLGEDLSPVSGLEANIRETSFCAGLRGVNTDKTTIDEAAKKIEELIKSELKKLIKEGIPKQEIEAALLGMEFSQKEIRRSGGPFSLVWMRRSLRTWLYGAKPWESLLITPPFNELKRRLEEDSNYFEKLISRYLLDNKHCALVIIEPQGSFLKEQNDALKTRLAKLEALMSDADKEALIEKNRELELYQEKDDSPEVLESIPHLSRSDLSSDIEVFKSELGEAAGLPLMMHPVFTNGITYMEMAFPLDIFAPDDYIWLPLFARTVNAMGLPGMDYGEVSNLIARTTGGLHTMLHTSSAAPYSARAAAFPMGILDMAGRDWVIFRLKCLDEKLSAALDLTLKLITSADFSDLNRLWDLVLEMKNDFDSSLAPSGHLYVSGRSGRTFSHSKSVDDLWSGFDQLFFAHKLIKKDVKEISLKLKDIQSKLCEAGVIINIGREAPSLAIKNITDSFGIFGPPKPRKNYEQDFSSLTHIKLAPDAKGEVFASSSLQVGFAGISHKTVPYASPLQAAELVFSHQLSTGDLWEDIRMKGGAYGAFAHPDHLEGSFAFSTYRDPNPLRSLDAFESIIKESAQKGMENNFDDLALDKAVIGTYSRETRPRSPAEKCITSFLRFLYGIEDSHRKRRLKDIINVKKEDIIAVQQRMALDSENVFPVILDGISGAEKAASRLNAELIMLPV